MIDIVKQHAENGNSTKCTNNDNIQNV